MGSSSMQMKSFDLNLKIAGLLSCLFFIGSDVNASQDTLSKVGVFYYTNKLTDSSYYSVYNYVKPKSGLMADFLPLNYNRVSIGAELNKGTFIPAQSSKRSLSRYFDTEGSTMLSDVFVYGRFSYNRISEDSTRWAHQSRRFSSLPFYYGSPAYVQYERNMYHFEALAEKKISKQNWPVFAGIDYNVGNHYSTNDPRGSVSDFQMDLKGGIGYYLKPAMRVSLSGVYGFGEERIVVDYINDRYKETVMFPDYLTYLVNGYGTASIDTRRSYRDNIKRKQGVVDFYFKPSSQTIWLFNTSYRVEDFQFYYQESKSPIKEHFSDYALKTLNMSLLLSKQLQKDNLTVQVDYISKNGKDYNYEFSANNYLYYFKQFGLKGAYTLAKDKVKYNFIFDGKAINEERKDGISNNYITYTQIHLKTGAGLVYQQEKKLWGVHLNGLYGVALDHDYTIPQQNGEDLFLQGVIQHDYLYNTSSYYGLALNADYTFPFYKEMLAAIAVNSSYIKSAKVNSTFNNVGSIPGDNRLNLNLSFNLYF